VANLADSTTNTQEIGRLVTVPAGTYTQDNAPAELTSVIGGNTYVDGIALTDGNGHRILVDTYDFKYAGSTSCFPSDGGFPDLSAGDFVAFADNISGGDGLVHKALYLANCGRPATPSGTCTTVADVATLRANTPVGDNVCLKGLVTVYASSYGGTTDDGGTQYDGRYLMADAHGDGIVVYKTKKSGPLSLDPMVGANVDVRGDLDYNQFPYNQGQLDLGDIPAFMDITVASTSTAIPTPDTIADVTSISDDVTNTNEIGRLVTVPAGTYTQDNAPAELTATIGANTYVDGVALTDTSGNKILVDTFDFEHAGSQSCFPDDGGAPDLSGGNFIGFVDNLSGGDGNNHKAVYLANCGQ